MKNVKRTLTLFLFVLMLASAPLTAWAAEEAKPAADTKAAAPAPEEDKVTGEAAVSVLSAYIWRGQEMTRHSVVIQPSVTASYKGFTANIWGNVDTNPYSSGIENHATNFTETDVTLSYIHKFGIVSVGGGYIYYGLHGSAPGGGDLPDSQEIFATVSLDTLLAPTLTVYKEIDHYKQWYATLGASHTFALHERIGLKLAGSVSYLKSEDATDYPEFDGNAMAIPGKKFNNFHDGIVSVSLPVNVIKTLTVSPTLSYVYPLSRDARNEMRGRSLKGALLPSDKDSSFLYGGIAMSFTF